MTDINELTAKLKAAAQKATPGEWWSDVEHSLRVAGIKLQIEGE